MKAIRFKVGMLLGLAACCMGQAGPCNVLTRDQAAGVSDPDATPPDGSTNDSGSTNPTEVPDVCREDSECEDNNLCTADACIASRCANILITCSEGKACLEGECLTVCDVDDECNDDNPCTADACFGEHCANIAILGCEHDPCVGVTCPPDSLCSEGECIPEISNFALGLELLAPADYNSIPLAPVPLTGSLPRAVDLSADFPEPGNQGSQGSCVGWAAGYALKTFQERVERGWSLSTDTHLFSPSYIYNQIKLPGSCDRGSYIFSALNLLTEQGCAALDMMPYDSSTCNDQPSSLTKNTARDFRIAFWRRINQFDISEVKSNIAAGFPVVIGMQVYDSFFALRDLGQNAVYDTIDGSYRSAHAIVAVGYDDAEQRVKVINSWGSSWGDNGYFYITYELWPQVVREAYVAQDLGSTEPLTIIASAVPSEIPLGGTAVLSAEASGGTPPYNYSWRPAAGLDDPQSATPTASPTVTTTYTVTVTDSAGSLDSDSISLTVVPGDTLTLDLGGGVTLELVRIAGGTFMMGSEDGESQEAPVHIVTITRDFYLGRYEVTQAQWQSVMGSNPSHFSGCATCPVEMVSWYDAVAFTDALSNMTGYDLRLPTEAEWEYACRAGTTTEYSFGNSPDNLTEYAWYSENSGLQTHEVGTKLPNPWELYDMHGNVSEWCSNWHYAYSAFPSTDPGGPSSGTFRVLRGSPSNAVSHLLRSARRFGTFPSTRHFFFGFRCAGGT